MSGFIKRNFPQRSWAKGGMRLEPGGRDFCEKEGVNMNIRELYHRQSEGG